MSPGAMQERSGDLKENSARNQGKKETEEVWEEEAETMNRVRCS